MRMMLFNGTPLRNDHWRQRSSFRMTDRYQEVLQHPVFQQQAAGVAADAAAATTAGVAAAEGDSPPVGTEPSERAVGVQIV